MRFFKRLLCCCGPQKKKSRRAREHVSTPDENHQQTGLEERSATVQHVEKERDAQPFTSQDLQVTSDPEMPTAQIQIQSDVNETASWNQPLLEETAAKIQPDLENLQHNIQDAIKITADKLQQSLRELYSKVEGELDEMDRKIRRSPPGRLETILLNNLHRENENILGSLAELVTRVQHDLDQTAAKIQTSFDNVAASVQCESTETKVPECGSEQGAQAAVGECELKSEPTAPSCELQERTGSNICEESFVFHKVLDRGGFGKKSRRAREEHVSTPDENHQETGLEERSATVQHVEKERDAQPFTSQDLQVTSDPEMPTAQIQILSDVNETASWNQPLLEETAAKIQPDLENLQHNIQDAIKITADKLQQSLRELYSKVEGELDEMDRKIRRSPPGRLETILLNSLHRENENILGSLAELVTRVQHDLDQTAAKIQTSFDNVAASVQCESAEKKVPECGSEQRAQAAVGESELKSEPTAPYCELQEKTGSNICEESFVFHKVLGRGGFGKVMLAELKASGEYYAVKTMTKSSYRENEDVDYLRTEKRVLMLATESPFLSRLHCTFQTEKTLFLVMELINGGNLSFHLQQRGRFDLESVRFYAAEIVCGLQFLHRNGVIYRDLKLENVMLDRDGHIKIVDFGLSKDNMFGDRRTDTFCGSPLYIAPEMYEEKEYSTSVDWWAFGVLLFQLLTGDAPFDGEDEDERCEAVCRTWPEYPHWVNQCTRDLLEQLLLKDPNCRLGTCGDIRAHQFFEPINWERIEMREVEPPYKPELKNPHDCSNFEEEFLSESPELSQAKVQVRANETSGKRVADPLFKKPSMNKKKIAYYEKFDGEI